MSSAAPDPPPQPWALLLGGGQGRRAGGPKALKLVNDRPVWRLQCERMAAAGLRPLAVLHPLAWHSPEPPLPGEAVASDPEEPAFQSVRRGLASVPPGAALWVLPVDCPWPGAAVLALLQAELAAGSWLAVQPQALDETGQLRGGHPLGLSAEAVTLLRALPAELAAQTRLDHWLRARAERVLRVTLAERAVLANHNLNGIDQ